MWIAFPALKKNSCLLETSFSVASALDEIPLGPPLGLASQMPFEDGDTALAPSWDSWLSDRAPLSFRPSAEAPVKGLHEFTLGIVLTILVDTRCLNRIGCQEHSESEFQTRTTPWFAQTNSKDCLLWQLLTSASCFHITLPAGGRWKPWGRCLCQGQHHSPPSLTYRSKLVKGPPYAASLTFTL